MAIPCRTVESWPHVGSRNVKKQLVTVPANIPEDLRELAQQTLHRLHLCDDERVLRQRRGWYQLYQQGKLTLAGLREVAPLIAAAVDKQRQRDGVAWE